MSTSLGGTLFLLFSFTFFMVVVFFTYRRGAKKHYDNIGQSVIDDDDSVETALAAQSKRSQSSKEAGHSAPGLQARESDDGANK